MYNNYQGREINESKKRGEKYDKKRKRQKPAQGFMRLCHSLYNASDISAGLGAGKVFAAAVKAPTVNPVLYDATTIAGSNLAKATVNKKTVIATVHVILKDSNRDEKANVNVTPKSGTKWKVDLPEGVKVAKGDTVTVYQQIGEDKSSEVTANAQPSKAALNEDKLKMPSGEIWIEQTSSNIVNKDEQA